jgi:sortase A
MRVRIQRKLVGCPGHFESTERRHECATCGANTRVCRVETHLDAKPLVSGTLRWTQCLLFAIALVFLGYYGFVAADAWVFEQRASHSMRQQTAAEPVSPAVAPSGLIGRVEIPRLGLSAILIEGDDAKTLRRAVGHIPGTPLPGQPGNVALSGHRDTFFRPLRNIREHDIIVVTTLQGEYRYHVVSTRIVAPDNVAVLDPGTGQILTLVTCYPFYFVGAAPDRLSFAPKEYIPQHHQGREACTYENSSVV